ncbi:MAG: hypothetical protein AAF968_11805, partial [Pseudomonadota bacterium]
GADLIAGFPTETDAAFEGSRALIEDCGLTWLHVFPFSARQGTPAARMPQLPKALRAERAGLLRAAGEAAVAQHLSGRVGSVQEVLMERPRLGRTPGFAEVTFEADQPVGEIVHARIAGVTDGRLAAQAVPRAQEGVADGLDGRAALR